MGYTRPVSPRGRASLPWVLALPWVLGLVLVTASCVSALPTSTLRARDSLIGAPSDLIPLCLGLDSGTTVAGDTRHETYLIVTPDDTPPRLGEPNYRPVPQDYRGPRFERVTGECQLTFELREERVQGVAWRGRSPDGLSDPSCIEYAAYALRSCMAVRMAERRRQLQNGKP